MDVTLRPVSDEHGEFLYQVYAGSRRDEVSPLPWNEEQVQTFLRMQFTAQRQDYRERFPGAAHDLICLAGDPVGRLYVDRREREIRILDIAVLPEHRRGGVGTSVIQRLIDEGRQRGLPVRIYVENHNPSYDLFDRLGFIPIEQDGFLHLLEWAPGTVGTTPVPSFAEAGAPEPPESPSHPEGRSHETH